MMKVYLVPSAVTAVAVFWSVALGNDRFVQADVYDTLHRAYVECDSDFGQSRSEFITEKLEHDSGQVSIASLKKILIYNVDVANEKIAQKSTDREHYVSRVLGSQDNSEDQSKDRSLEDKGLREKIKDIDALLKEKRRYVEVHECVLATL